MMIKFYHLYSSSYKEKYFIFQTRLLFFLRSKNTISVVAFTLLLYLALLKADLKLTFSNLIQSDKEHNRDSPT